MNKMSLDDRFEVGESGETIKFVVKSTDPRHTTGSTGAAGGAGGNGAGSGAGSSIHAAFVCHGLTQDATGEWVETIKQILQSQRDFLRAIQSPIKYQNEQQRLSSGLAGQHL